ncbi:FMI1 protein [Colletotrichum tofieldiae]|nr:FMI1 protein [Colletotrichum tofieldiae]
MRRWRTTPRFIHPYARAAYDVGGPVQRRSHFAFILGEAVPREDVFHADDHVAPRARVSPGKPVPGHITGAVTRRHRNREALLVLVQTKTKTSARARPSAPPPPFELVPTCPSPTCECAATPAMPDGLEIDHKAPLNGVVSAYAEQVLVCTGKDDWASRIEEENSGDNLAADLKELFGRGARTVM